MARQRVPEGPPPAPAVQKLRIRYARRGRLRFSSTRDFQRALERAVRRAGVPMAYSAGFHPHPKISYAGAAPTGTASEAEYVEISVVERLDPAAVRAALDDALPDGLDVVEVVEATPGSLADRLEASHWVIRFPGVAVPELEGAVAALLARDRVEVIRTLKNGPRTFDARSAIALAEVLGDEADGPTAGPVGAGAGVSVDAVAPAGSPCAILQVVVRHTTPAVRPDDILTALTAVTELVPPRPPMATRLAQGPLDPDSARVADPLAADKEAAGD